MKYIDRLFVFLLALVVILVSAGVIALSTGLVQTWQPVESLVYSSVPAALIGLVALLISLRMLQVSLSRQQKGKQTVITSGELGNVKITLSAIKKLVKDIIKGETEIEDIKCKVKQQDKGINIFLDLTVASADNISNLAKRLQKEIKEQVAEATGVEVAEIEILVEEVKRQEESEKAEEEVELD